MILRLVIWLVFLAAPVVSAGLYVRAKRRRQRLLAEVKAQGRLNAALTCNDCFGPIHTGNDDNTIYDEATGKFYHRRCFQKLLA